MLVKVTQEHKERAVKESSQKNVLRSCICPVAQALKDTFGVKNVIACYNGVAVGIFPEDNIIFTVPTPYEVKRFMLDYDTSGYFEPFEFELSLEGVKL